MYAEHSGVNLLHCNAATPVASPEAHLEGWTVLEIAWRNPHEPIHPQKNATCERKLHLVGREFCDDACDPVKPDEMAVQ